MNRLLVIILLILTATLLLTQSIMRGSNNSRVRGVIVAMGGEDVGRVRGEHKLKAVVGDTLRRGEIVQTGESMALIEYAGIHIALAHNTEVQFTAPGTAKLIGGRVLASGPVTITTPWIEVRSQDTVSVVNYAWKG